MEFLLFLYFLSNLFVKLNAQYDYYDYYDYCDYYDYYDYYDYCDYDYCEYMDHDNDYVSCEDDFCMDKTQYVPVETHVPIRDTNLMEMDYDSYDVLRESAIRECSPSLELKVSAIKKCFSIEFVQTVSGFL